MTSLDPERLLGEVRWMRALARELAGGAGEDVVQEALVVALERPLAGRNLGAWLSGVVRNLARRARRAEEGRPRREQIAARSEAEPATDELVAEGELQRELVAAVMRLDEPYRATVLLHYFRGRALVDVAREQGLPAATVRTRLRRALERLRQDLDGRCGGREGWAVVALGFQPGLTHGGGVLMATKGKLALACVAGALALAVWRAHKGLEEPELAAASPATVGIEPGSAVEADPPGQGLDPSTTAPMRAELPATPAVAEVLLHGTARDTDGREVEVWAQAEDEWAEVVRMEGIAFGAWSLAGLHPGRWTLRVGGEGLERVERVLVLDEAEERLELVLEHASPIRVRVLDEAGIAVEPGSLPLLLLVSREPPAQLGLQGDPNELFDAGRIGSWSPDPAESEVPPGYFGLVRPAVAPPFHVSLLAHRRVLETRRVEGPIEEITFEVQRGALVAQTGAVSARLVDGVTGEPLAGVSCFVTILEASVRGTRGGIVSGTDGRVKIDGKVPGVWRLHAVSEGRAYSTRAVRVEAGATTDIGDVELWPTAIVAGRALDEDGKPHEISLRWLLADSTPFDLENVNYAHGGTFVSRRMPATRLWLLVRSEGFARQTVYVDASSGKVEDLELRLVRGQRVVLRSGAADIGRQVSIVTAEGGPIGSWSLGARALALTLAPGTYELWSGVAEQVEQRTPFVVGDGPLRLDVPPARE